MSETTLIFSFDGTGNEPADAGDFIEDESITNILKLHLLLGGGMQPDGKVVGCGAKKQKAFYYNGIGTRENGKSIPWLGQVVSAVNMMFAPTWGDARRILAEAEDDFKKYYKSGNNVVVFGYSRGAALARKFVSRLLDEESACPKCDSIAFLGVFDTVAAMNGVQRPGEDIASDVLFENGTLHKDVQKAVHIVALDEDRVLFRPTLCNRDAHCPERITEIWFPGVHGDIGGGYWHDGLSDNTLEFMVKQCETQLEDRISFSDPRCDDQILSLLNRLKVENSELVEIDLDDVICRPVLNGPMHEHKGGVVRLGRAKRHVRVNDSDSVTAEAPLVHSSVVERFAKVAAYRPPALRGLTFKLYEDSNCCLDASGIAGLSNRATQRNNATAT